MELYNSIIQSGRSLSVAKWLEELCQSFPLPQVQLEKPDAVVVYTRFTLRQFSLSSKLVPYTPEEQPTLYT
jgi:hypothetical protein